MYVHGWTCMYVRTCVHAYVYIYWEREMVTKMTAMAMALKLPLLSPAPPASSSGFLFNCKRSPCFAINSHTISIIKQHSIRFQGRSVMTSSILPVSSAHAHHPSSQPPVDLEVRFPSLMRSYLVNSLACACRSRSSYIHACVCVCSRSHHSWEVWSQPLWNLTWRRTPRLWRPWISSAKMIRHPYASIISPSAPSGYVEDISTLFKL